MLDRQRSTVEMTASPPTPWVWRRWAARAVRMVAGLGLWRWVSSSVARRILALNLAGLAALFLGVLWVNQTRTSVIDARVQSLLIQGEIMAAAVAGAATLEGDLITIDPERLLSQRAGEAATDDPLQTLVFAINPERVAPVLRRLVTPTRLRARVYDPEGQLLIDTRTFYTRGSISWLDTPPPPPDEATLVERPWSWLRQRFGRAEILATDDGTPQRPFQEVSRALQGIKASVVRVSTGGHTLVYVALPIQRGRVVQGALLLSTQEGDVDRIIADERNTILILFGAVTAIMALLSLLLANTIARPIRRLASAADRVRRAIKMRHQIPDLTNRGDEIGHLSSSLRDMTQALYQRIEAIESFAADVAHELKNPLTSLRSAVETLPRARSDAQRTRLLAVIAHDVRRLDRLISDISDASRLDAELARLDAEIVDLAQLVRAVTAAIGEVGRLPAARIVVDIRPEQVARSKGPSTDFLVVGHESRLGQVLTNLLDNARSFAPAESTITVRLARRGPDIDLTVEDEGPGIPEHALQRIFERFYTDRPEEQGFGQNSGLGLSISKQIVEAHRGMIWAENRPGKDGRQSGGARFVVRLPAAQTHDP